MEQFKDFDMPELVFCRLPLSDGGSALLSGHLGRTIAPTGLSDAKHMMYSHSRIVFLLNGVDQRRAYLHVLTNIAYDQPSILSIKFHLRAIEVVISGEEDMWSSSTYGDHARCVGNPYLCA